MIRCRSPGSRPELYAHEHNAALVPTRVHGRIEWGSSAALRDGSARHPAPQVARQPHLRQPRLPGSGPAPRHRLRGRRLRRQRQGQEPGGSAQGQHAEQQAAGPSERCEIPVLSGAYKQLEYKVAMN
ncbi:hypothetical protein AVEN_221878-1 [Araneus ventricosus]|uniref:Uncharacterized protein n=1 Tax=Araneus ventricosus TaxID=182803 RepID=A0A4Y2N656_ARAVE|nr:hypothetical protein AVEN_221878-1 [Araneus ventricosus]